MVLSIFVYQFVVFKLKCLTKCNKTKNTTYPQPLLVAICQLLFPLISISNEKRLICEVCASFLHKFLCVLTCGPLQSMRVCACYCVSFISADQAAVFVFSFFVLKTFWPLFCIFAAFFLSMIREKTSHNKKTTTLTTQPIEGFNQYKLHVRGFDFLKVRLIS